MRGIGGMYRSTGRGIRTVPAILGLMCAVAGAQIDVNETGLHDGQAVYGINSPLIETSVPVTLLAWGATEPHSYTNVSFYAYGIFAPSLNSGAITVDAAGGVVDINDLDVPADASSNAYGLYRTLGSISNRGRIRVTALGGTAVSGSTDGTENTDASARAYGLFAEDGGIRNYADVTIIATGGSATGTAPNSQHEVFASAWAHGLALDEDIAYVSTDRRIDNIGDLAITALGGDAQGSSDEVNATARAYGVEAPDAPVINCGQIAAAATGGTALSTSNAGEPGAYANALAYGIDSDDGDVDNSGVITAHATGGTAMGQGIAVGFATAETTGIHSSGGTWEMEVRNTGAITVEAVGGAASSTSRDAQAYAIAQGFLTPYANVDNAAAISVTARGGTASAARYTDAWSTAYGMYVENAGVNNTGSVTVTSIGGTATTTSPAPYTTLADASVYTRGIAAEYMLNNTADVTVAMAGGTATGYYSAHANAFGYGLRTFGTLTNSGNVLVTAAGGTATGGTDTDSSAAATVDVEGLSSVSQNNTGTVTVIATGGTARADDVADASVRAVGIAGSPLINTGAVSVTATAGITDGTRNRGDVFAVGISAGGDVSNSGAITVAATAAEGSTSQAYGIRVNSPGNLTNTGIIRATGDTAYELSVASGTTTLVDTYNVTLDGDPAQASLGVADGATLALNDATLTVTAIAGETLWDTEYRLFETAGTGVIDGNFAEVQAVNPNTTATYYDQGTVGSVDDSVSLAYTPGASSALAAAAVEKQAISQAAEVVNHHMTSVLLQNILSPSPSSLLADAGSTAESLALLETAADKSAGVFVEPYYSRIDKDANPLGYDAGLWGFSAGYERFLGNTLLGLHLGYGQSDIDYTGAGYSGNSEDQDVVTGGFSGLTRWDPWILRYGLTGFYGSHEYQGLTGFALEEQETASYDSYGAAATVMAGRIFRRGSHVLLPEAGLNWLWAHRQRYTTEATDPAWDATYSAMSDHDLQAAAALRWLSSFLYDDVRVTPSASLGIRHLLTDAETSAWQSVTGAAPVLVRSEQDRTAMTLSGSVTLTRTQHALSLAYDGEYSPDAQRHNIWLRFSWLF